MKEIKLNSFVEKMTQYGLKIDEISDIVGIDKRTLSEKYSANIRKGKALMKMSLRRSQFNEAMKGSVQMLIWLGKQYLDQKEPKITFDETPVETYPDFDNMSDEEVEAIYQELIDEIKENDPAFK